MFEVTIVLVTDPEFTGCIDLVHSTEFTGTQTILPDKIVPSATSFPSDTNIHINSFFVVTQLIRYKISTL
jgi:hypothetical protein